MPPGDRDAIEAAVRSSTVEQARAAVDEPADIAPVRGAGSQDPLIGDLRRGGLLSLLVLHFVGREPCYGNQLIERIAALTEGALTINPNTMYPLLRRLEARGLVEGHWEQPDRRSRRFYRITPAGAEECDRLHAEVAPRLQRIARSIEAIGRELGS